MSNNLIIPNPFLDNMNKIYKKRIEMYEKGYSLPQHLIDEEILVRSQPFKFEFLDLRWLCRYLSDPDVTRIPQISIERMTYKFRKEEERRMRDKAQWDNIRVLLNGCDVVLKNLTPRALKDIEYIKDTHGVEIGKIKIWDALKKYKQFHNILHTDVVSVSKSSAGLIGWAQANI